MANLVGDGDVMAVRVFLGRGEDETSREMGTARLTATSPTEVRSKN
jgi:hypothetical protein